MTVRVGPGGRRSARRCRVRPSPAPPCWLAGPPRPVRYEDRPDGRVVAALVVPWRRRSRRPSHRSASLARPPPLDRRSPARRPALVVPLPRAQLAWAPRGPRRPRPPAPGAARAPPMAGSAGGVPARDGGGRSRGRRRPPRDRGRRDQPSRALQAASEGAPPALEGVLGQAIQAAELGAGPGSALATAARAEGLPELALAGEALDLAETTGAPPGPVLAGVAAAAADRVRSRQARMAATAQARLSARVVAAMAPAFLGVLALTAPSDAAFLVREPLGWATLASAAVLELLGIRWATRIVRGSNPMVSGTTTGRHEGRPSMRTGPVDGEGLLDDRWPEVSGRPDPARRGGVLWPATVAAIAAGVLSAPSWRRPSPAWSSLRCSRRSPGRSWAGPGGARPPGGWPSGARRRRRSSTCSAPPCWPASTPTRP